MSKRAFLVSVAMVALLPVSAESVALAQEVREPAASGNTSADSPSATVDQDPDNAGADIVVTGSRITRPGFTAPTPLTSITTGDLANSGVTNVGSYLSSLPAFAATNTPQATGNITTNAGGNFLNLRNLGGGSTLILIDGLRHVPTDANNRVDINTVPAAALDRIDVVTGGASAAWGSDAIAGVVNLITADRLTGIRGQIQQGVTSYGDNSTSKASLAAGADFEGGRGHILVAGEYERSAGIPEASGRGWAEERWGLLLNPVQGGGQFTQIGRPDVQLSVASENGLVNAGPLRGVEFLPGGATRAFRYGTLNNGTYMVGGGGTNIRQVLSVPFERHNLYLSTRYDITETVTAFVRASYGRSEATNPIQPVVITGLTARSDNPFLPESVRAAMAGNGLASIRVGRIFSDIGPLIAENTGSTYDVNLGLRGRFGMGWSWTVAYGTGQTDLRELVRNNIIIPNLLASVDAVATPAGPACRSSVPGQAPAAGALPGCVPINLFGAGSPGVAAREYVTGTSSNDSRIGQSFATVSLEGPLFDLPGGPLSIALGGEYRENSVTVVADPLTERRAWFTSAARSYAGETDVKEVFLEASAPLLRELPFAYELGLNGAIRYTDYSLSGGVTTWKVGATWMPSPWLLVRGTRSRDIRAPNLAQLFSPGVVGNTNVIDPCAASRQAANPAFRANCAAEGIGPTFAGTTGIVSTLTGGNPNLVPERANTWTAGIVLTPRGVFGGLRLSVDYYDIDIADRIGTLSVNDLLIACYQISVGCGAIQRDSAGQIVAVQATQLNIARQGQRGVDFELNYSRPIGGGTIEARALATYVIAMPQSTNAVTTRDLVGNVGFGDGGVPEWKGNASVTWDDRHVTLFGQLRYIDGGLLYGFRPEDRVIEDPEVDSVAYVDASIAFKLGTSERSAQFFVGANNLLNTDPPRALKAGSVPHYTNPQIYDIVGRYVYAGLRFRL